MGYSRDEVAMALTIVGPDRSDDADRIGAACFGLALWPGRLLGTASTQHLLFRSCQPWCRPFAVQSMRAAITRSCAAWDSGQIMWRGR